MDGPSVEHPSSDSNAYSKKTAKEYIAETAVEEAESKWEGNTPMCDHVNEQYNFKGPQPGQLPSVINAITTPGRTSDGNECCLGSGV